MSQGTVTAAPTAGPYDYDGALRVVLAVQRAVASDDFHAGVVYGYEQTGRPETAAAFTRAVDQQREFAALEAEFANETAASAA